VDIVAWGEDDVERLVVVGAKITSDVQIVCPVVQAEEAPILVLGQRRVLIHSRL